MSAPTIVRVTKVDRLIFLFGIRIPAESCFFVTNHAYLDTSVEFQPPRSHSAWHCLVTIDRGMCWLICICVSFRQCSVDSATSKKKSFNNTPLLQPPAELPTESFLSSVFDTAVAEKLEEFNGI